MRRVTARAMLLCTVASLTLAACGEEQMERGIPDHVDSPTPVDAVQLGMTEEERRQAEEEQVEKLQQKAFDATAPSTDD